jgi:hypothetical protein
MEIESVRKWEERQEAIRRILASVWKPDGAEDSRERYAYVDAVRDFYRYLSGDPTLEGTVKALQERASYSSRKPRPEEAELKVAAQQLFALDIERQGPQLKQRRRRHES